METNNLDQIFKEKLASHTATPDAQAWSELDAMLGKKEPISVFWYYGIAASVALLLVAGVSFYIGYQQAGTNDEIAQEAPILGNEVKMEVAQKVENIEESIAESSAEKNSTEPVLKSEKGKQVFLTSVTHEESAPKEDNFNQNNALEVKNPMDFNESIALIDSREVSQGNDEAVVLLENVEHPMLVMEDAELTPTDDSNKKKVKITFKTSAKSDNNRRVVILAKLDTTKRRKPDLRNILKSTLEFPETLLADVRDAKDNLFHRRPESNK